MRKEKTRKPKNVKELLDQLRDADLEYVSGGTSAGMKPRDRVDVGH